MHLRSQIKLTGRLGDNSIEGRSAIEGAVGSKVSTGKSLKGKAYIAKGRNPKITSTPKKNFK